MGISESRVKLIVSINYHKIHFFLIMENDNKNLSDGPVFGRGFCGAQLFIAQCFGR